MDNVLTDEHQAIGITFDGNKYAVEGYKYAKLADAVAYAELQRKQVSISEKHEQIDKHRINKLESITLSTVNNLPKNRDYVVLDLVTSECVFGMNAFRDLFAAVRDLVGGRSSASEKVLKDLKATCLTELKEEAYKVGADAVLGVDLDYSEFSGGGKSMLFLVASGTAVKIIEDTEDQGSRLS